MPTIAVVRAIPHPPHKYRYCGLERWVPDPKNRPRQEMREKETGGFEPVFDKDGERVYAKHALPWPADEVKVFVVDDPKPFDPEANGGRPVEISPRTVEALRKDHRIAVQLLNGDGGDPAEAIEAKGKAAKLEDQLRDKDRLIASLQEQVGAARDEAAAKVAGEIAKLKEQLAEMQRRLAERKK